MTPWTGYRTHEVRTETETGRRALEVLDELDVVIPCKALAPAIQRAASYDWRGLVEAEGYKPGDPKPIELGTVVVAHTRGRLREAAVYHVTPTKVALAYTTPSSPTWLCTVTVPKRDVLGIRA